MSSADARSRAEISELVAESAGDTASPGRPGAARTAPSRMMRAADFMGSPVRAWDWCRPRRRARVRATSCAIGRHDRPLRLSRRHPGTNPSGAARRGPAGPLLRRMRASSQEHPRFMRIASVGGGPAGLYFSILMKKSFPDADITVYERNRADDTFGWGVVFSDETLGHFEEADPESFSAIRKSFATWDDIDTYVGDERVTSTGHGFCGLSRRRLLEIFHERCRALGVALR